MEGVVATIHNGTSYFTAGDAINVDWPAGQLNFTFNASEPSSNTVYIRFTSDGSTSKTPHFWAQVGMRSYNATDDEEETTTTDDDEDDPVYPVTIIPISKELTFNEKLTMWVVLFAILTWCLKERYCKEKCCCSCCFWWTRIVRQPDEIENEFRLKVR